MDAFNISKLYIVTPLSKYQLGRAKLGGKMKRKKEDKDLLNVHNRLKKVAVSAERWVYIRTFNLTEDCIAHLEKNKWTSLVTSPHLADKTNLRLDQTDFTKYKNLAIWMGNEVTGISKLATNSSDSALQIQMHGHVESLNLACASAVILYQVTVGRRNFQASKEQEEGKKLT
jgi:tRNA (guanosine-2'-O-)-methyltransferase